MYPNTDGSNLQSKGRRQDRVFAPCYSVLPKAALTAVPTCGAQPRAAGFSELKCRSPFSGGSTVQIYPKPANINLFMSFCEFGFVSPCVYSSVGQSCCTAAVHVGVGAWSSLHMGARHHWMPVCILGCYGKLCPLGTNCKSSLLSLCFLLLRLKGLCPMLVTGTWLWSKTAIGSCDVVCVLAQRNKAHCLPSSSRAGTIISQAVCKE